MRKIELLAPARNVETGIAAIDFGADAVYIGGPRFGARHAAGNVIEDIARLCDYARPFGVRVYATLNTLIFPEELVDAEKTACELIAAGVDALIVQDMAFTRMRLEGVELHASTQTTNITPEGVAFLEKAGFSRVILERNLTLTEIEAIRKATSVELECFVHGAICVGFSGRCYLSRATTGRSGNRGECSQPCRLPYDLVHGDEIIISGKHLLSVRDLNLSGQIPALIDAGITSFKIEGRLKDTSYIKNNVAHYRAIIDKAICERHDVVRASSGRSVPNFTPDPAKSFTRGFTEYFINGKHSGVTSFDTPKAIGESLGCVETVWRDSFSITKRVELAPGDGICFVADGELTGTNINKVEREKIFPNRIDGITQGMEIFRNYDHRFTLDVDRSRTKRLIDISAQVFTSENKVALILSDNEDMSVNITREGAFESAKDAAKMLETIKTQVSKSGGTIFRVCRVEVAGCGEFIPVSILSDMRREALDKLYEALINKPREIHQVTEDKSYPYPTLILDSSANAVNPLAKQFYQDHRVEEIMQGLDYERDFRGKQLMTTSYCIRREIGQCLKDKPKIKGELYLQRGSQRYKLNFNCSACIMTIELEK